LIITSGGYDMTAMNITEISKQVDNIVDALFISIKKEQVESVFNKNNINNKSDRIHLLRKCMHVIDTSNIDDSISLDDEYIDELTIFLNGKWRLMV
jgi:hypothetical protein